MSKNAYGGTSSRGMTYEWGSKTRKEDTKLRGLKHTADREAIAEQVEHKHVWRYENSRDIFRCLGCNAVETA